MSTNMVFAGRGGLPQRGKSLGWHLSGEIQQVGIQWEIIEEGGNSTCTNSLGWYWRGLKQSILK